MSEMEKLVQWLQDTYDLAFIHSTPNVYYLSNFYCQPHERLMGILAFAEADPILVCPALEADRARSEGWSDEIVAFNDTDNPWEMLASKIKKYCPNPKKIAIESDLLPYDRAMALQQICPGAQFGSVQEILNQMRNIKSPQEIELMQEAARLADLGIEIARANLREGVTELDLVAEIEYQLKKAGASKMSFSTMVLFGPKSAEPHGSPDGTKLKPGDLALFDLGVVYKGYCSDITRTFAYKTISPKLKEIYQVTLQAQLASLALCKPNSPIGEVDKGAREVITTAGYGQYFTHRIGHGLGLDVHEYPSLNETNQELLKPGMTFTVEPGIYLPGLGGVRIEDDILITPTGHQTLTQSPKQLQVVGE